MEINNIQIRSNNPYPEIVGGTNDARIVSMLKDLLASREGEITGVMQYFYQSRIAQAVDEDIAKLLEEISVVEMEHMEMLMNAIIDFGGNPTYTNNKGQFFNTGYVNCSQKLKDMLDTNVFSEQQAIDDYTKAQRMTNNQSLKNLFARIIEDEELHLKAFKFLRDNVKFLSI